MLVLFYLQMQENLGIYLVNIFTNTFKADDFGIKKLKKNENNLNILFSYYNIVSRSN
jgi:hypothetical protein